MKLIVIFLFLLACGMVFLGCHKEITHGYVVEIGDCTVDECRVLLDSGARVTIKRPVMIGDEYYDSRIIVDNDRNN